MIGISSAGVGQESWNHPVAVTVEVRRRFTAVSIQNEEVTLRPFAGALEKLARRRAAFDPPLETARTTEWGGASLKLPWWSMLIDKPVAVVCRGDGDMVLPFARETHRAWVAEPSTDWAVKFTNASGQPLAGARIAALIGVHHPSSVREGSWSPRYENLVVAAVAATDHDGLAVIPSSAVVALVDRDTDVIPVVVDRKSIVVPDTFEAARLDERLAKALKQDDREPPTPEAVDRADRGREGTATIEGQVVCGGYDSAEIIAVPVTASLDILAAHLIRTVRPQLPFAQTESIEREKRFHITGLPAGRYRLQVAAPHFAPRLTKPITVSAGERVRLKSIELEPGGLVLVKGTMGYVTFGRCSLCFGGPNGVIDGLGPGRVVISSWNGGCCGGASREVTVPRSGEVIVDLSDEHR